MQLSTSLRTVLATADSFAPLVLRLTLAAMILPHGLQKTFGWFGGYGFNGTMGYLTGTVGAPWLLALLAILAESLGAVLLVLGLGTRIAALGLGGVMAVAASMHLQHGFFMNWFGQQAGEGVEFHLLALGIVVALLISGGGKASLDRRFSA